MLAGFVEGGNALASVGASGSPVLPVLKVSLRAEHFFEGDFAGGSGVVLSHGYSIAQKRFGASFFRVFMSFFSVVTHSVSKTYAAPPSRAVTR